MYVKGFFHPVLITVILLLFKIEDKKELHE